MSMEYQSTAIGVFLASVHRARDSTGLRPTRNVVSSALFDRIIAETCMQPVDLSLGPQKWLGQILDYPVRVVKSKHLFALSLDEDP